MTQQSEVGSTGRRRLSRRNVVVLGLLCSGLGLLAVTRTWVTVDPPPAGVALTSLDVSGTDAAAAVLALSVVSLVCSLAATISGKIARWIISALQALVGLGMLGFTLPVLTDPATASASQTAKSFGLQKLSASAYHLSFWPWLAIFAGVLVVLAAVLLAVGGRGWRTGRRFERSHTGRAKVTSDTMDDVDRWDAFTDGDDPTDGDVRGARYH